MKKATKAQISKIKELLRDKKRRDEEDSFVAEGCKITLDILTRARKIEFILVSSGFLEKCDESRRILDLAERSGTPVLAADNDTFDKISSLRTSQGVLAVTKKPIHPGISTVRARNAFGVLCDGVQDPGNLGSIIRAAAAFGADMVILTGDTADVYNPKVVRASSGAVTDIPVYRCDMKTLDRLKKDGFTLLAASPLKEKGEDIRTIKKAPYPLLVAFGSEGKGISPEIETRADGFFHIPIRNNVESLNVTAAASVSLYAFSLMISRAHDETEGSK